MTKNSHIHSFHCNRCLVTVSLKESMKKQVNEFFKKWDSFSKEVYLKNYKICYQADWFPFKKIFKKWDIVSKDRYLDNYKSYYLVDWVPYPSDRFSGEMYDRDARLTLLVREKLKDIYKNEIAKLYIFEEHKRLLLSRYNFEDWNEFTDNFDIHFSDLNWDFSKTPFEKTKI